MLHTTSNLEEKTDNKTSQENSQLKGSFLGDNSILFKQTFFSTGSSHHDWETSLWNMKIRDKVLCFLYPLRTLQSQTQNNNIFLTILHIKLLSIKCQPAILEKENIYSI